MMLTVGLEDIVSVFDATCNSGTVRLGAWIKERYFVRKGFNWVGGRCTYSFLSRWLRGGGCLGRVVDLPVSGREISEYDFSREFLWADPNCEGRQVARAILGWWG